MKKKVMIPIRIEVDGREIRGHVISNSETRHSERIKVEWNLNGEYESDFFPRKEVMQILEVDGVLLV